MPETTSTDGFLEFVEPLGPGDPRVLLRFVLEHDESLIAAIAKNLDEPTYVSSTFLFRAARLDLHLELHVHGVRHAAGDVAVNVIGVEIAGVEIDAHPLALDRPDDFKKAVGLGDGRILFTSNAVILGLVYGYLPFMVLPLYAAIERIDWNLVEGARDLYASGWSAFRRVVWPLSKPGVVAGSILVFVPSFGAYVTPAILGGNKEGLLGSYIVLQFLSARNGPVGSAVSVVLLGVMLMGTLVYFRSGGKNL